MVADMGTAMASDLLSGMMSNAKMHELIVLTEQHGHSRCKGCNSCLRSLQQETDLSEDR